MFLKSCVYRIKKGMINLPRPRITSSYFRDRDTMNNAKSFPEDTQANEPRGAYVEERPLRSGLCLYQTCFLRNNIVRWKWMNVVLRV